MPTRKPLRLPGYEYRTPGAYFITVCTENKAPILGRLVCADATTNPLVGVLQSAANLNQNIAGGNVTIHISDAHIGPPTSAPVGADAHIGPSTPTPVGADAHIGPHPIASLVGADAHIGPQLPLSPIGRVVEKHLRNIPGVGEYVIMPNHVHLILHISADDPREGPMWASAPTTANVPSLIRSWKILVTKELGRSIWQRSYYDHIIRDEQDYRIRVEYIRNNPLKWRDDHYFIP